MTPAASERLDALQVLRAVAALAIVLHHTLADAASLALAQGQAAPMPYLVEPLAAGVDLFFVISGFVMVYASRRDFAVPGAAPAFVMKRLIRIVPLYWLVTTLFLFVAYVLPERVHGGPAEALTILQSYLFIPALRFDGTIQPVFSLGWTLNYEMMFYALFALALFMPRGPAIVALLAVLAGLAVAGNAMAGASVPVRFWTSPIILEFALGVLIGEAYIRGFALALPLAAIAAALGLALVCMADIPQSGWYRLSSWGLGAGFVVAGAALAPWRRLATVPLPLVALGDASYALYLTHPFAMRLMSMLWSKAGLAATVGSSPYILFAVAAAVVLALATHRLVEVPVTQALRQRWHLARH